MATRILVLALLGLAACGDDPRFTVPAELGPTTLGMAHVEDGRLVDAWGRELTLRGVNLKLDGIFDVSFADGRTKNEVVPPWGGAAEARAIASHGFDFVRLCLSWSGLEPEEGHFDDAYLALVDTVVADLNAAGLYVLVDFHQDAYGKDIGEDGAPAWAIVPAPPALLSGPLFGGPGLDGPFDNLQARRTSAAVLAAFTGFFRDQAGVQTRFWPAWQRVAARFAAAPGVIGFENLNEPMALHIDGGDALLDAFHVASAERLRQVDRAHALWLEPEVTRRNIFFQAPLRDTPFPDRNVVYEPHLYMNPPDAVSEGDYRAAMADTFDGMVAEAASYGAAPVLGEYGSGLDSPSTLAYLDAVHGLADERGIGLAVWLWRDYGGGPVQRFDAATGAFVDNANVAEGFARAYAIALPGRVERQHFDRGAARYEASFVSRGDEAPPLVFLPAAGYVIELDGTAVAGAAPGRVQLPGPLAGGRHTLVVRRPD